eukprot:3821855-Alexandrium_andersonii.AAC.1
MVGLRRSGGVGDALGGGVLMSTVGIPPAGGPRAGPAGPRDVGLELVPGSRPGSGTPPLPEAAETNLDEPGRLS